VTGRPTKYSWPGASAGSSTTWRRPASRAALPMYVNAWFGPQKPGDSAEPTRRAGRFREYSISARWCAQH
jgi:hypothetical protein